MNENEQQNQEQQNQPTVEEQLAAERDRADRAEQRLQDTELREAAGRAGFVKPAYASRFIDLAKIERDADGNATNLDTLLSTLLEEEPWLKKAEEKPADKPEDKPAPGARPAAPAVPPLRRAGAAAGAANAPAGKTFTTAQISDRAYYNANKAEIQAALREGRIVG